MLDLYCERLGPGLWSEPLNAATNLAFFVSAFGLWKVGRARDDPGIGPWILVAFSIAIGVGSGLFHTFATTWAGVLDVVPILAFQMGILWLYCRKILEMESRTLAGLLVAFLATTLYARQFPNVIGGSLPYLPAALVLLLLGLHHLRRKFVDAYVLLIGCGVFAVALVFRSVDSEVCAAVPIGTHFLWHILNAVVIYLVCRGYLENLPPEA
jgi:hypothetical protein